MDFLKYYNLGIVYQKELSVIRRDINQIDKLIQSAESANVLEYLQYTRRVLVKSCENLEKKLGYTNSAIFNGPVLPLFSVPYISGPVEPSDLMEPIKPSDLMEPIKPSDLMEPNKPSDLMEPNEFDI